jgi:CheY-like chemotaxis protein
MFANLDNNYDDSMNVQNEDRMQLMLAEDDDDDYYLFSITLSEIPVKALLTRVANGEELMKLLAQSIPDILFLDVLMPCKDGQQCLREIRANTRYDRLPVVVYSSMEDVRTIEFCYRNRANQFVVKQVSLTKLKDILEVILKTDWKKDLPFSPSDQFVVRG